MDHQPFQLNLLNKIYVPHYYGQEHFGSPKELKISEGSNIDIEFAGSLRAEQVPVVETYIGHVNKSGYGGGLLELPCAFGKTCLALNIISQLKKKTFIIVHKEFLMNSGNSQAFLRIHNNSW